VLEFGFDAPHRRRDTPFTVAAFVIAAFCRTTQGQLFVRDEVGVRVEFQSFPCPPAIVAEFRMAGTRYVWRASRSPVIGTQVVVTLLAVASLGGRFRRIRAFTRPRFMACIEILLC